MRALAIVGSAGGGDEPAVAAALTLAARAAGETVAVFVAAPTGRRAARGIDLLAEASGAELPAALEGDGVPLVAARHAGVALDPDALAARAHAAASPGSLLVVATSGGLLAPLGARYAVRDLVRELDPAVVVAARAGAGLINETLLTLEAVRGAGLRVAAVVVTGWGDAPGRVLLDERALLTDLVHAPLMTLTEAAAAGGPESLAAAAASWPVVDWADAAVPLPAGGGEAPAVIRVTLEPYRAWEPRPLGDPRATPRPEIMQAMLEIVGAEGPMRASRAYALYNRSAGGRKLTTVARAPLSSAIYWLAREGRVVLTRSDDIPWQGDDLVRLPDTAPVDVRELGPRTLEEVPLDEIAELIRRLRSTRGAADSVSLKRAVLGSYGLMRLTARADEYLGLALDLSAEPEAP